MYTSEWGITCSSPTQTNQSLKIVNICIKFMSCRTETSGQGDTIEIKKYGNM